MIEHVVERESRRRMGTSLEVIRRRRLSPAPERTVDAAPVDPAHAADAADAGHGVFDGHALCDKGMDSPTHLLGVATQESRPLRPGEDTAVETSQGDPFGPASCPAERLQRHFASLKMSDHSLLRLPGP